MFTELLLLLKVTYKQYTHTHTHTLRSTPLPPPEVPLPIPAPNLKSHSPPHPTLKKENVWVCDIARCIKYIKWV